MNDAHGVMVYRFRSADGGEELIVLSDEQARKLLEILGKGQQTDVAMHQAYAFARQVGRCIEVVCTFVVPRTR